MCFTIQKIIFIQNIFRDSSIFNHLTCKMLKIQKIFRFIVIFVPNSSIFSKRLKFQVFWQPWYNLPTSLSQLILPPSNKIFIIIENLHVIGGEQPDFSLVDPRPPPPIVLPLLVHLYDVIHGNGELVLLGGAVVVDGDALADDVAILCDVIVAGGSERLSFLVWQK